MAQLLRPGARAVCRLHHRSMATSADIVLSATEKQRIYPRTGNRDVVGFGFNGQGAYYDSLSFPCPAIRFKENTPDALSLREKEKGDWKSLSLADKKALYRNSFCQTFAEINAPDSRWKAILATVLMVISAAGWFTVLMKKFVYAPLPSTFNAEWKAAQQEKFIKERVGLVTGISSKFDYSKGDWK